MLRKADAAANNNNNTDSPLSAGEEDTPFSFPETPAPKENKAVADFAQSIALIQNSPSPWMHYWVLKQLPWLRRALAVKDAMLRRHIDEGMARLAQPGAELTCAMDRMIQREVNAARKAGTAPDVHSPRMYDSVCGTRPSSAAGALFTD